MKFTRHFTKPNLSIADQITWKIAESKIAKANGEIIFHMENIEVPSHWSQQAVNILAQKYFRKAGVPNETQTLFSLDDIKENEKRPKGLPIWLWPSTTKPNTNFGSEISAKQVFHRLAGAWTYWGWKEGIFNLTEAADDSFNKEQNAQIFYDEIYFMLAHQFAAPNSPQWFNTGLHWAYGITGDANGQWICDESGPTITSNSYEHPQPHACFIQPISDNLVESGGIFDLLKKEALLFKHGSGTGTNFSNLRAKGEKLAGGGVSSGLMSFLKIFDTAAGAISSGGTTRRAAKMICLDLNHPEIEEFINWKMNEEAKAASLYVGSTLIKNNANKATSLCHYEVPEAIVDRLDNGIEQHIYDLNFEGEAINTVSAQNANNSIRITNHFLENVDKDEIWNLISRSKKDGRTQVVKTLKAKSLWNQVCRAAWACGDPGLQFDDTINEWHTCKNDGIINASNPCSEYMFLDDTACNLASLNLDKFLKNSEFQIKDFTHATRLWTIVLEISVYMASFPSKEIAQNSYAYRTLGLGYANLGGILMRLGLSYDSEEGRRWAQDITALMHGISYLTSSEMADELGPFSRFKINKISMLEVINKHNNALIIDTERRSSKYIRDEVLKVWKNLITKQSFRNAQVTLLAPTGTIALLMDCDTTGIEPDFSLIKYKNLSGGGVMQIVNECIPEALKNLGYTPAQIQSMLQHIDTYGNLEDYVVNGQHLPEEHLCVFDCANPSGTGKRYLRPMSHVLMMAAVQPFLSGAISKTCNLPNSATIQDVDHIYRSAHRLGLKAIAIYRDGSKLTQPLSSKKDLSKQNENMISKAIKNSPPYPCPDPGQEPYFLDKSFITHSPQITNQSSAKELPASSRKQLPSKRSGYAQKVRIDGQSTYLRTGNYEDGKLGEFTIEISREGSTVRALLGAFSKLASIALQFGVPLEQLVKSFVYTKFEPAGLVQDHDNIKMTTSVLDFVFRDLAINYLGQTEFANVIQTEDETPIYLDLDALKSPLPLHEKTLETEVIAYSPPIIPKPKSLNFTGNSCPNCGHMTLIQTGTCVTCTTCNSNTGCG